MLGPSGPVLHRADVLSAVLHADAADVHVAHHVAMQGHVLPDQKSETNRKHKVTSCFHQGSHI